MSAETRGQGPAVSRRRKCHRPSGQLNVVIAAAFRRLAVFQPPRRYYTIELKNRIRMESPTTHENTRSEVRARPPSATDRGETDCQQRKSIGSGRFEGTFTRFLLFFFSLDNELPPSSFFFSAIPPRDSKTNGRLYLGLTSDVDFSTFFSVTASCGFASISIRGI